MIQSPGADLAEQNIEGDRHQTAVLDVSSNAPWILRLMLGTPRFPASRFEYFVLCMIRAMVAPVLVLFVPGALWYVLFGQAGRESVAWTVLALLVHAFFEEHARLSFGRAINSPLGGTLVFSLGIGVFEFVTLMPMADEVDAPIGVWQYYAIVRGICLGMHLCCGVIVGLAACKGNARAVIMGVGASTLVHTLFNLSGVSRPLANWLVGA